MVPGKKLTAARNTNGAVDSADQMPENLKKTNGIARNTATARTNAQAGMIPISFRIPGTSFTFTVIAAPTYFQLPNSPYLHCGTATLRLPPKLSWAETTTSENQIPKRHRAYR